MRNRCKTKFVTRSLYPFLKCWRSGRRPSSDLLLPSFYLCFFVFDFTYVNVSFRCGWKREESCLSILLRKSVYSAPRVLLHAITFTLTRVKYEKNRPLPEPSRLQEGNRNSSQRNATNFRDRHSAPSTRAFIIGCSPIRSEKSDDPIRSVYIPSWNARSKSKLITFIRLLLSLIFI